MTCCCHEKCFKLASFKEEKRPDRSNAAIHVGAAIFAHVARSGRLDAALRWKELYLNKTAIISFYSSLAPFLFDSAIIEFSFLSFLSADPEGPGFCAMVLTGLALLLVIVTLPFSLCTCIKVVAEYERSVIFRLGRLRKGKALLIRCGDLLWLSTLTYKTVTRLYWACFPALSLIWIYEAESNNKALVEGLWLICSFQQWSP